MWEDGGRSRRGEEGEYKQKAKRDAATGHNAADWPPTAAFDNRKNERERRGANAIGPRSVCAGQLLRAAGEPENRPTRTEGAEVAALRRSPESPRASPAGPPEEPPPTALGQLCSPRLIRHGDSFSVLASFTLRRSPTEPNRQKHDAID